MPLYTLDPLRANPQNGQTHSNNSSPTNCLSVFDHFVGLPLKGYWKFGVRVSKKRNTPKITEKLRKQYLQQQRTHSARASS